LTPKKDHDICCWKSKSWIGRGTNLFYNKLRKVNQPAKKNKKYIDIKNKKQRNKQNPPPPPPQQLARL
jgi:hypothetical protein